LTHQPITVKVNQIIILLNALIWLILTILLAINKVPGLDELQDIRWVLAIISITMAAILLALNYYLLKHSLKAFYLTIAFFGITSILIIFDDVGLADVIFFIISLIPIILLIKDRSWYLQAAPPPDES
jgi:hypothetical protein